jgi:hypothetical protein
VRPGVVQASVWPWTGVAGRSGSWRIGCGHAGMWPPVHRPILCLRQRSQVLDQMSTRETAARNDLAGDESNGAWASGQHGATTCNSFGLLGSKGARMVVGGRRGEAVAGVGAATSARRRYSADGAGALSVQEARDVRARARAWVHMRVGVSDTGLGPTLVENGRRGGAQADAMGGGEQDDHSWAQTRVSGSGGRWRCVHSPVKRAALPSLCPRARGNHPRRGHGGEADRSATLRSGARKGAEGPASPPGLRRARAGVHACARATLFVRTCARTRTRRRRATSAAKTGWLTTARRARLGKRRACVGEGGGTYKKVHPSLARCPASPAASARWRGAGDTFPPRLEGRGVHKGQGGARPHLGGHGP